LVYFDTRSDIDLGLKGQPKVKVISAFFTLTVGT